MWRSRNWILALAFVALASTAFAQGNPTGTISGRVTDPDNTTVLWPGSVPELTLVTCYPFYYFGNAPQRFVVRAELHEEPR